MMGKALTFQLEANDENKDVIFFLIQVDRLQKFCPWVPLIPEQDLCFWENI